MRDFVTIIERLVGKQAQIVDAPLPDNEALVTYADVGEGTQTCWDTIRMSRSKSGSVASWSGTRPKCLVRSDFLHSRSSSFAPCEAGWKHRFPHVYRFSPDRAKNEHKEGKYHAAAGYNHFCVRPMYVLFHPLGKKNIKNVRSSLS